MIALPPGTKALRAFALACQNELAAATAELQAAKLAVQLRTLEIEKLKLQIAKLPRMQFGRSSERLARHRLECGVTLRRPRSGVGRNGSQLRQNRVRSLPMRPLVASRTQGRQPTNIRGNRPDK